MDEGIEQPKADEGIQQPKSEEGVKHEKMKEETLQTPRRRVREKAAPDPVAPVRDTTEAVDRAVARLRRSRLDQLSN